MEFKLIDVNKGDVMWEPKAHENKQFTLNRPDNVTFSRWGDPELWQTGELFLYHYLYPYAILLSSMLIIVSLSLRILQSLQILPSFHSEENLSCVWIYAILRNLKVEHS